jgi:hypothetical protein
MRIKRNEDPGRFSGNLFGPEPEPQQEVKQETATPPDKGAPLSEIEITPPKRRRPRWTEKGTEREDS